MFRILKYFSSRLSCLFLQFVSPDLRSNLFFIFLSCYSVKLNDLDLFCFHPAGQYNEVWGRVLYNFVFTDWRHCVSQNSKCLCNLFLRSIFHIPPTSLKIWWNFVVYFVKLDNLVDNIFPVLGEMRPVIFYFYYMPNRLFSMIHNTIPPIFQECWGEMKKWSVENVANLF